MCGRQRAIRRDGRRFSSPLERLERFDYFKKTVMEENNFLKKLVRWSYLILVLSLIGAIFYFKREARNFKDMAQVKAVELSTLKDNVSVLQKKNGELAFQIGSIEVEKRNLKESLAILGIENKDLKEMGIRQRNLISLLKLEIESFGSVQTTVIDTFKIVETDTIYFQKVQDWDNGYLNLFNAQIEKGQFDFNYKYSTGINIFQENRKKDVVVTVQLSDPNASIVSGNSITISDKKKFYERPVVWGVAGFLGGYLITK